MNKIDKIYCMSHYVAFRFIKNENINFFEGLKHKTFQQKENLLYEIFNITDIEKVIKKTIEDFYIQIKQLCFYLEGLIVLFLHHICLKIQKFLPLNV